MAKLSKFGAAFAAARKAGKKEFTFGGKRFNTKMAADTPKKAPTPTAAPRRQSGATSTAGKVKPQSGASRSTAGKVSAKSGASRSTAGKVQPKRPSLGIVPKGGRRYSGGILSRG